MRRALLASSTLLIGLSTFARVATAGDLYRIRSEYKFLGEQADGTWKKEEHYGLQKFDLEAVEWGSIFSSPTFKANESSYHDENYSDAVDSSWKYYGSIDQGTDQSLVSADSIYTRGWNSNNEETLIVWDLKNNTFKSYGPEVESATNFPYVLLAGGDANGLGEVYSDFAEITINGISVQGQIDDNKTAISSNKNAIRKNKKAIDTNRANINNLGDGIAASTALGAALSALPVTPDDAPFSCGVGSGAYSSRFAMGLGCVAKLNQRLSLNAGGSHVFGGSSNYGAGSLDSVAWRGGFVLKLGKLDSPAATNEQLQSKVKELEERNAAVDAKYSAIQEENAFIKAKYSTIEEQNAVITQQNKALMARLERLEAIALGQQPATTTASLK